MTIYERIRSRRIELGISQGELANKLGYKSRSSISKIESGVNDIPYAKIDAFAVALNTTTVWLMMGNAPSCNQPPKNKNNASAITELQFLKEKLFNGVFSDKVWALDVAIEVLSQNTQ